ncbi:uncharacterized protein KD926_002418 [Aspergillus affinis]|uniref:uncharacterized protein n=1 Tax=Aspergillus affinis TaxID=1070780 RepID=UPI0022FEFDB7|nr:uncharacterized protein KD926_002418 [Aspergillus affinis]KAI9044038.1 hypothetical protein KD926_002418 [Aspergillus affinis]
MIDTMSEQPRVMAKGLVTTAATQVTAHDELLGSVDGLECIMMEGLPQGSPDRSMASGSAFAGDTDVGRLERLHCVIASRILERNDADLESCNFDVTQQIDADLQNVSEMMSSG